ncbi:hypothetical protein GCM10009795_015820 [Nocardioides hankookensis]|uniref:Uncharacterized protein n=1 Tax=Nocardioides hankookensis TaxID=443157 RepID=A0ABW1LIH3_9ACTN
MPAFEDPARDARRGLPLEGWSPFEEDLLLRAVRVDLVRRTVGFTVTYDDAVFEGAPTGDWLVELDDASPVTLTRLAVEAVTGVPGRIYWTHQPTRVGRGLLQLDSHEVLVNTIGTELPATRAERLSVREMVPVRSSANHTTWTLLDWDDDDGAERIEQAHVDGCRHYLHHPVVTLAATVAAQRA